MIVMAVILDDRSSAMRVLVASGPEDVVLVWQTAVVPYWQSYSVAPKAMSMIDGPYVKVTPLKSPPQSYGELKAVWHARRNSVVDEDSVMTEA